VIVGAGAMGSLFGFLLHKAGKDVWLLDKHTDLTRHIQKNGLRVEGISGDHQVPIPIATNVDEIQWGNLIIIFVKAYDTAQAILDVRPLIGQESMVLTLQNGIGNVEAISKVAGETKTIAGTTAHGATVLGPGHIRHAGRGETIIGELNGQRTERLDRIQNFFESAGIPTQLTHDVPSLLWSKLLINVGINPLTGITGLRNGELLDFEETREIMHRAVDEAKKVVSRKGIRLMYEDHLRKVDSICQATARNISSMLQDLRKKKRTEIDFINGIISREGNSLGIETPINQALTHLIHCRETQQGT
ncbi:MAG: 2-dehydropantoate 2-reductase, partial [Deltaproteobacteria bacterium]|nr:2-dehydropantoate 2-reductase [Deltaproteobacteria bacterium]